MQTVLNKASTLLTVAFSELIAEPYFFTEPDVDFKTIVEQFPEWLHSAAMSIKRIHRCIQSNKESFTEQFTDTGSFLECLFQMYKDQTNEEYEDSWFQKSRGSQKGKPISSKTHVTFVIEDICKQLCKRSEETTTQRYQKQITKLQDINQALEEEKITLLTRLSKFAGANLTDNNPNIADLSDPNRPTKLAEEYSELYDNEWTNAFEALEKSTKSEKEIHSTLHDIIIEMFKVCSDLSRKQDSILKTVLVSPTTSTDVKFQSNEGVTSKAQGEKTKASGSAKSKKDKQKETDEKETISAVHSKAISELRKQTANSSFKSILKCIKTQQKYSSWFTPEPLEEYTVHCIKLCWWMNVQNPPVYVDQETVKAGSLFDTTKFKPYTKAGKKVGFVVWPALYLHQGGPLLAKGVAQGK